MKYIYDGIEMTESQAEAYEKQQIAKAKWLAIAFFLVAVIGFSVGFVSAQQSPELTSEDMGKPAGQFPLYPVIMDEGYKTERASYAYNISGGDKDFVKLLNSENGAWTHDDRHGVSYMLCWTWDSWNRGVLPNQEWCWRQDEKFSRVHYDHGFCGMSDGYKKQIVDDPRFYEDWKWQIGQCYKQYKIGTTFYGWGHRNSRWIGEFVMDVSNNLEF